MSTIQLFTKYNFFTFELDLRPVIIDFYTSNKIRFVYSSLQPQENYDLFMTPARREMINLAFDLHAFYSQSASGLNVSHPKHLRLVLKSVITHLTPQERFNFSKVDWSDISSIEFSQLAPAVNHF